MATFSVPLKTFMLDICSLIKKFNEDTTTIKELIFSSPLLLKNTHIRHRRMEAASHWEIFHIQLAVHKWYLYHQQQQSSAPHIGVLFIKGPFSFLNWIFWREVKQIYRNRCGILRKTASEDYFIFPRVSREYQRRQKQGDDMRDVLVFRALFVFTRPITHAQFVKCRTLPHMRFKKPET